jgi:hypothetical protein
MNVQVRDTRTTRSEAASRLAIADCDIHPAHKSKRDLDPYLEQRWIDELRTFGPRRRVGVQSGPAYPKSQPNAARRDAFPEDGNAPGSDLDFMRRQLLDPYNIQLGVLNATGENGQHFQNRDLGNAHCRATNHWQIETFTKNEPRLKASLVVPYEDTQAGVAEIEHWAGDPNFVQIILQSRSADPLGNRRYWPIYEAAAAAGLPVGVHAFGFGGHPPTGSGWASYYIEDMVGHAQSCQGLLISMLMEGVFERIPKMKLVLIEAGFGWLPPLAWRLDKLWKRLRAETPHLKRLPSEYIRDHVWLTTQPMEEPEPREHVLDTFDWVGWDRMLFATDYPHWDFDDPDQALQVRIDEPRRRAFFYGNAAALYGVAAVA